MEPKIEAATQFVKANGKRAVITFIEDIEAAVEGRAGTEITTA
jgi:carbamate kinase